MGKIFTEFILGIKIFRHKYFRSTLIIKYFRTSKNKKMKNPAVKKTISNGIKKNVTNNHKKEVDLSAKLLKLFDDELKDIYWAEKALVKAIPKLIKNATSEELVSALNAHLKETENQVIQLEKVFKHIGKDAQAKKCEAMDGLIREAGEIIDECEEGAMRDIGIITAAQKIEHYEIATYGTLQAFAEHLGYEDAAELLEESLVEEKNADEKLTHITEMIFNNELVNEMH